MQPSAIPERALKPRDYILDSEVTANGEEHP